MKNPRSLPSLNALRAFEAAARLQSVSAAATELHVTHGAVSRQLRLLEEELGLDLFERGGRGIRPNAQGRQLQQAAADAFERIRGTVSQLRAPAPGSALVLGCPGSLLARWMIPRLPALQRDLPDLTLHLSAQEGDTRTSLEGVDAALLIDQGPWPAGWQVEELAAERIGPVMAPALAAGLSAADGPRAVLSQALLHTASRPQAWPAWARTQGMEPAALHYGTGFEHLYYLLEAAVAGVGIAIAPQALVADDLAHGRLVAPWGFGETGGHWALCRPAGRPDHRIDALAGWLRAQLGA